MSKTRKQYDSKFKGRVALAAIQREKTLAELCSHYQIHATQILQWKKQALEGLPTLFEHSRGPSAQKSESLESPLYEQIGRLKVEVDWLKKKTGILA